MTYCLRYALLVLVFLAWPVAAQDVIVGDDLGKKPAQSDPAQSDIVTDQNSNADNNDASNTVQPAGIRIGGSRPAPSSPSAPALSGDFRLEVSGVRARYRVGDSISFQIRGSKTFFLWAYTHANRGEAVLLVPSRSQPGNKYPGGRTFRLPNPGLHFYADDPGAHQIVLVASTRWLDIENWLRRHARVHDEYWVADIQALEAEMQSKGVRIGKPGTDSRPPQQKPRSSGDGLVVHQLSFDVIP